jgi:LacI family transcriptional regulator
VVLLATTDGTPDDERAAVAAFTAHRADSIVIAGSRVDRPQDTQGNTQLAAERVRGFQRGLAAAGMPTAEVVRTGFDRTGGYKAGLDLSRRIKSGAVSTPGAPLCILTGNDVMAIGAAAALRSGGIRTTRDASIAGFDGTELLRDFRLALSTAHLALELIGHLVTVGPTADGAPAIKGEVMLAHNI